MSLWPISGAVMLFVCSHIALSGTSMRGTIVGVVGELGFRILFMIVAVATLVWMVLVYAQSPIVSLWYWGPTARWVALVLMALAIFFVVAGASTRNPMILGMDATVLAALDRPGILSVTRHPLMWGIALWAVAHILVNGHGAAVILFGGLVILALFGAQSQDRKKQETFGDAWDRFTRETPFVPLGAIAAGRTDLDLAGIGWLRPLASAIVFAGLLWAHPLLFDVSPLP